MNNGARTSRVLRVLIVVFFGLATAFVAGWWGDPPSLYSIPLVDTNFLSTATARQSYADLVAAEEDLSDFDCYICHEQDKPPPLRFDENHKLIIPDEHANIVMEHGRHDRNNNCFNCHNESNLERLQTRDGQDLKFADSTALCGSCHGPSFRDWEAGAHGRTSGYWARDLGAIQRKDCVNCHNPHSPRFPGRPPAPGPYPLRPAAKPSVETSSAH